MTPPSATAAYEDLVVLRTLVRAYYYAPLVVCLDVLGYGVGCQLCLFLFYSQLLLFVVIVLMFDCLLFSFLCFSWLDRNIRYILFFDVFLERNYQKPVIFLAFLSLLVWNCRYLSFPNIFGIKSKPVSFLSL